jgi:hypothetical protein
LVLEITESTLIDDGGLAIEQLRALRAYGVRTALDDFGTGYSSLAYVQRLPLDIIKIDKEFVQSVDEPRSQALANTILNMARNLGLSTVAEGVESECQALELARLGCEFAQGYLFFKPLSAVAMTALAEFEHQPKEVSPRSLPRPVVPAFAAPTIELPALVTGALPPPTGQLPVVDSHLTPQPTGQVAVVGPPPNSETTGQQRVVEPATPAQPAEAAKGEMTHLLRPLLSN